MIDVVIVTVIPAIKAERMSPSAQPTTQYNTSWQWIIEMLLLGAGIF